MPGWLKALLIVAAVVVLLIVAVVGILIGTAAYGWKAAMRAGNEAATIQNLKTIAAVEIQYYDSHQRAFGTFDQMVQEKLLSAKLSGNPPMADGYIFTLKVIPRSATQPMSYTLNADPQSESTGNHHFYLDSTDGTIRVNSAQRASASDPQLGG
jgi:Tfp pilus assembly protein PilE